jgi:hypothetical protein
VERKGLAVWYLMKSKQTVSDQVTESDFADLDKDPLDSRYLDYVAPPPVAKRCFNWVT